ncbi:MAG: DNA internalization-related competence protein ComEC/Rec2 [Mobilitalea sp.]
MIKRPLVWLLAAYLAGMYLAWQRFSLILVILSMIIIVLIIYIFMFRVKKKLINRRDGFLWVLPLLLLLGFYAMRGQVTVPVLYQAFEQETSCELTGNITMIVEKQWGRALYVKDNVISLSEGDPYLCENVIVFCYDDQNNSNVINYLVGNQITVQGTLQKFSEASNPGQFNEQLYYQIENIDFKLEAEQITITDSGYSKFHAILGHIKNKLICVYDTILSEKESGTLIAMLLGEKYLLDDEIKQLYQQNGISHVLAISGLHISLIGMFIFHLLKKCKVPIAISTFLSIFFIYSYGILTNSSISTNRAVVMMTVMLLSAIVGKTYDMLSATALSALLILLQNPLQILSVGFLLSFGAVIGIAIILPSLRMLFPTKNTLLSSLYISVSAQATTTPLILYFFYQFPVYSIITNLLILPCITVLTLTSILAGIAGAIYLPLGIFLIGGSNYILKFYEWVCRIGSNMPGNLITVGKPDLLRIILYVILLSIFVWGTRRYSKKYMLLIFIAAILMLFVPQSNVGLEITILDVGQGDAIFMESENGITYLIDGGSSDVSKVGINRIQPFLLSQGVGKIDYAIMSHSDNDHISGLKELIEKEQIDIKNLILPNIVTKDEAYFELENLANEHGITLRYIEAGDAIEDGEIKIVCLHPTADYIAASSNAYSTVLSIRYGEFDMLMTGDLEKDGEELITKMLKNPNAFDGYAISPVVDYDVLKVAHHGSKNSTFEEFLQIIKPENSIISCGLDNGYGHPHEELLRRVDQIGSDIKITYESGAITIKTDGKLMEISEYRKK